MPPLASITAQSFPRGSRTPGEEHLAVRTAAGLFDFSFRAKFAMKGRDRVRFLHRIVSNDVKSLAAGRESMPLC